MIQQTGNIRMAARRHEKHGRVSMKPHPRPSSGSASWSEIHGQGAGCKRLQLLVPYHTRLTWLILHCQILTAVAHGGDERRSSGLAVVGDQGREEIFFFLRATGGDIRITLTLHQKRGARVFTWLLCLESEVTWPRCECDNGRHAEGHNGSNFRLA